MKITGALQRIPPPSRMARTSVIVALFCLVACALSLPIERAHATEDVTEPGVVYVQHCFADGPTAIKTQPLRAFATYTEDRQAYTARINASGGAVDVAGCWSVQARDEDITSECSYDTKTGLVTIPKRYLDTPVYVTVSLDTRQSAKTFWANVSIVSGDEPGQSTSTPFETSASNMTLTVPVSGQVKAVTQDSRVLDSSEYRVTDGVLTITGRSALTGSLTVYLEGFSPDVVNRNPIKDYSDTLIQRSLRSSSLMSMMARSDLGGWFDGWGWIWSTNQGPGDWDYTDYIMSWNGNSIYLNCCQHGVYHMPQSEGGGGSVYFTASRVSTNLINQYDTSDATTIYHYKVYRNTYYVYVDAGWYQDVDGYWSEDYETVSTSPRLGGIDLAKVSANPSLTNNNPQYSLAGAVYGVFSDAACTSQLNSLTTDSSGRASLWDFYAGSTAYVKEIKASPGYNLDTSVYTVGISADQWEHVNGGSVFEPPRTVTVRYFVDGDTSPIYIDSGLPLGHDYTLQELGLIRATNLAKKPNCTPGLNAWYSDKALTKKYEGSTLTGDIDLYARNVATLTYAIAPSSKLTPQLPVRAAMSENSPLLDLGRDVLPRARQVNWGTTVALVEPKYSTLTTLTASDGERCAAARWDGTTTRP